MAKEYAFISETFSDGKWTSTYTHPASLQEYVSDATPKEFHLLVSLASNALKKMNSSAENIQYKEALDKEIKSYTQILTGEKAQLQEKLELAKKLAASEKEIMAEKFLEEIKSLKLQNESLKTSITQSMESKHRHDIATLSSQIDSLKSALAISEQGILQMKTQYADISSKSESTYKACLADMMKEKELQRREEIDRIESMNEKMIDSLRSSLAISEQGNLQMKRQYADMSAKSESNYRASLAEITKEKELQRKEEINRLQSINEKMIENIQSSTKEQHRDAIIALKASYAEQEERLRKELEKSASASASASSDIGKQGEMEFEDMVAKYTRWGALTNTSKLSHGGDRSCKIKGCDTIFEVKKYSNDVPSKEVDKFMRDMEEHPETPLGVFASLNTHITGKKSGNFIQMTWTAHSQLLIFINCFNQHSPPDILGFIDICADIALSMFKLSHERPQDSEMCISLQININRAKDIVSKELMRISDYMNVLAINKKSLIETITKHYDENRIFMKQVVESLKETVSVLLGKHEEVQVVEAQDQPLVVEASAQKKPRTKKSHDKANV